MLPIPLTALIGREHEVAAVVELIQHGVRLVTLTGPGGTGKTRLAIQVATQLAPTCSDGVWFVSLAPIRDPGLVVSVIAQALSVRESADQPISESVITFLRDRGALIVLDNFEQIIEATPLVAELLDACPALAILVTSRTPLRLYGERDVSVPPLSLPVPGRLPPVDQLSKVEAVRLFVERAQAAQSDFRLTPENAAAVAGICVRLDGLPLAIELAAARVRLLSPQALLERLERRLPLLIDGPRNVPARQQTLRDTIAWSYELLSPEDQRLFRQLSIFVGGWTLEAAEAICPATADILAGLTTLVDHSLIRRREQPDGSMRFGLLETIREYGLERLEQHWERQDVSRRHAAYFLTRAEAAPNPLDGRQQVHWLDTLEAEHDNLRSALRWAVEHDVETALRLAGALGIMWFVRGYLSEGRRWLELVLARGSAASTAARAKAHLWAGDLACWQYDLGRAQESLEDALRLYRELDDREGIAWALYRLARTAGFQTGHDPATGLYAKPTDHMYRLLEECLAIHQDMGNAFGIMMAHGNLGATALYRGDRAQARKHLEEAFARGPESYQAGTWLYLLGDLSLTDDVRQAQVHFTKALVLSRELRIPRGCAEALEGLAQVAAADRQFERAVLLYSAASALRERISHPVYARTSQVLQRDLTASRAALGDVAFDAAWYVGQTMPLDEAIALALTSDDAVPTSTVAPSPQPAAVASGLSRRELDVVRLLAEGKSNQEIAAILFISPHTAATHVQRILAKLGLDSRAAIAAYAVRHGLA
jgi:non-specific serine/threonine protein kinase